MIFERIRFTEPINLRDADELIVETDDRTGRTKSIVVIRNGVADPVKFAVEQDAD